MEKCKSIFSFLSRILGLCNNFPYVIMLSAAYDILEQLEHKNTVENDLAEV